MAHARRIRMMRDVVVMLAHLIDRPVGQSVASDQRGTSTRKGDYGT